MEYILAWFLFGFVTAIIAGAKGRSGCGWFLLGVLLGPFALVIVFLPTVAEKEIQATQLYGEGDDYKKCPFCAEVVRKEAVKCKHCSSNLPALSQDESTSKTTTENINNSLAYKAGKAWRRMTK